MVTLIGMGSGKWEALSAQAQQAVRSAGLVFGAKRLLAGLPADCTARQFALYQPADILETLAQNPGQDAAVLYSGDTGFYSGASGLLTPLRALGIPARVYPGVSSIQMLSAALGRPWQDWKLVSAHGCACDPVAECMMNRSVFFLTGGTETPASLCQKLTDAGMGEAHGVVGENLGTEAEAIRYGSAAELAGRSFAPLSVLLVENFDLPQLRAPGLPGRKLHPERGAHDQAGGARCCAGQAGGNAHRHSVGCGRRHRQCERGACAGGTQRPRLRRGV